LSLITKNSKSILLRLGRQIRERRQELGLSATATAEAAGLSRVTLYRIEQGEGSVTIGAYINVIAALGLSVELTDPVAVKRKAPELPNKVRMAKYKQLKRLAWQIKDTTEISPREALDLYERNWRHIDLKNMDKKEREFLNLLLEKFGRGRLLV
jgi:transcriptional regulator with XRE-family HTH domain